MALFLFIFLALLIVPQCILAQSTTRLYVPGFNQQMIIGDILGVDGEGRTTWALRDGQPSNAGFPGTATLISGPNYVSLTYAPFGDAMIDKSCSLTLGLALCATTTALESAIAVETPTLIPIRIAVTETPTPSPQPLPTSPPGVQAPSTSRRASGTSENPAAQTSCSRKNTVLIGVFIPMAEVDVASIRDLLSTSYLLIVQFVARP
ncbi:hypothetical protein Hypma_008981 [Hypsizygus marmoreus]|uniref:Uncharacterized protein n=1 Tax=Hypsizygus marmoreus TaxID=39966 RepID=A0A369JWJ5_HYPMA|nr:hypothetical protein Hypma_008981 [Hypsizygus marmoreus]